MSHIRCPGSACPHCGRVNDSSSPTDSQSEPKAGDVSICAYCSFVGIFTEDLLVRLPTEEEQVEIDDSLEVQRARGFILQLNERGTT
jgi:hypothetical protein